MSNACVYAPKRASKTFYKLKKEFGYDKAWDIWYMANSNDFLNKYKDSLTLDSEGFPTYDSLIENESVRKVVPRKLIGNILSKQFKVRDDTIDNYKAALQDAYDFNSNNKERNKYVAIVNNEEGKLRVDIVPKSKESMEYFKNQYSSLILNERLSRILGPLGVSVGLLSDIETKNGRVGVTDFSIARQLANDTVEMIKIANNMEGVNALSEEFSHLIIGAMRNQPLMERAINQIANEDTLTQILGNDYKDVYDFYNGNMKLMAEEALGHILRDRLRTNAHTTLLDRLLNYIKNIFRKVDRTHVEEAIAESEAMMDDLASKILRGTLKLNKEDIRRSQREVQFNALSEKVERNIGILKGAIDTEAKRYKILKDKSSQSKIINLQNYTEEDADTAYGICLYAKSALDDLKYVQDSLNSTGTMEADEKFKTLRTARSILQSYGKFINELNDARLEDSEDADNMFLKDFEVNGTEVRMEDIIKDLNDIVQQATRQYMRIAVPSFAEFIRPILGDEITIELGKDAGKKISIKELLSKADSDISFMDRWLDSMANSSDILLQTFDALVKQAHDKARLDTINDIKYIQKLQIDAEKSGVTSWDWIYEKDRDGNRTGNIISEINEYQYQKDLVEFKKKLDEKYGKNPKGEELKLKKAELMGWHSTHSEDIGIGYVPSRTLYRNKEYAALDSNHKELLKRYLQIKDNTDKKLPKTRASNLKAVQMRKDGLQRFIDSTSSPADIWTNIKQHLADEFLEREDDDQLFGNNTTKSITDFSGKEYMTLPILYTTPLKDANDLTNDAIGALMAYSAMGNKYSYMDEIIDPLEIGRSIVTDRERKVQMTQGGKKLQEKFSALGLNVVNDVFTPTGGFVEQKLNDFFESQVYGRYLKREGSFEILGKKFSGTKIANWVMRGSSMAMLGLNVLANVANVTTGVAMQNIEAAASEFFTAKQLASADAAYASLLPAYMAELNKRNKQSKLGLIDELFNVKGEFFNDVKRNQRKGILSRVFGGMSTMAFIGQNMGDHWLYNRTLLAMMKNTKVRVPGKGETNLYDALQIRNRFEDNDEIKELYLPFGTTDENGNEFDIGAFSRKVMSVNQRLFGIYNDEDKNAAKRLIAGRAMLQFRDWIKPQMNARFQKAQYNLATKSWEEGYYRTFLRIGAECIKGERRLGMLWSTMTAKEKQNVKRSVFELLQFGAVWALCNFVEWDKDKHRPWLQKFIEYTLNRSKHELGFLAMQPTMVNEALANLKSPAASLSMIGSFGTLAEYLITPSAWSDEIQSGPYKGMTKLEKSFISLPIPALTQYRQIDKVIDDDSFASKIRYYMKPSSY